MPNQGSQLTTDSWAFLNSVAFWRRDFCGMPLLAIDGGALFVGRVRKDKTKRRSERTPPVRSRSTTFDSYPLEPVAMGLPHPRLQVYSGQSMPASMAIDSPTPRETRPLQNRDISSLRINGANSLQARGYGRILSVSAERSV